MKKTYTESVLYKARNRLARSKKAVILPSDLADLGSYSQVNRVINRLIEAGELVKISKGVYAKSFRSEYSDTPLLEKDFGICCREALTRLGVNWEDNSAIQAYNQGLTTQVPSNDGVRLKSRNRRIFEYAGCRFAYEDNINAK